LITSNLHPRLRRSPADMARSRADSYADATQKKDVEEKDLDDRDQLLNALEEELQKADSQLDEAEIRYTKARARILELGSSPDEHPSAFEEDKDKLHKEEEEEKALTTAEVLKPAKEKLVPNHAPRNAKVVPEKVLSCQKWLQKRSSDNRSRQAERKSRDLQRRGDRDRKFEAAEITPEETENAPPARERAGSGDSAASDVDFNEAVQVGAKSIAQRLTCLSERPNPDDKRAALLKTLTCGRPGFYSFNLCDVLFDLRTRGELEEATVDDLLKLLADEDEKTAPSSEPLPPSAWLAHAKKMSQFERLDDAPFKDSEALYLGRLDGRKIRVAEAELEAAEAQLETAVALASEAYYSQAVAVAEEIVLPGKGSAEPDVHEIIEAKDKEIIEAVNKERESKGMKNTSVLPPKVVSCQKWLQARGVEMRARDSQKKARDLIRSNQRDNKRGGGYA